MGLRPGWLPFFLLLYLLLGRRHNFRCSLFLGSGPNRVQSPTEWGDFSSIHPSVCPPLDWPMAQPDRLQAQPNKPQAQLARPLAQPAQPQAQPARPQAQPAKPPAQLARPQAQLARPQAQPARPQAQPVRPLAQPASQPGGTDRRMDIEKFSPFYRTLSPIWAAALLLPMNTKKIRAGQGNRLLFE